MSRQTYSLAEIRNGTGFPPDVRFAIVAATSPKRSLRFDPTPRDTSQMSDTEMHAYFKRRGLYDDASFHAAHGPLPQAFEQLAADMQTRGIQPIHRHQYAALLQAERAAGREYTIVG